VQCDHKDLQTIQIADTSVFLHWGYILYPRYFSMFSDNDYTAHALKEARVIDARFALYFRHNHPLLKGIPLDKWDETYRRSNEQKNYEQGLKIFNERVANEFAN
jgi:hypothetical protein